MAMKVLRKLGSPPRLPGFPRSWGSSHVPLRVDHGGDKISACKRNFSLIKHKATLTRSSSTWLLSSGNLWLILLPTSFSLAVIFWAKNTLTSIAMRWTGGNTITRWKYIITRLMHAVSVDQCATYKKSRGLTSNWWPFWPLDFVLRAFWYWYIFLELGVSLSLSSLYMISLIYNMLSLMWTCIWIKVDLVQCCVGEWRNRGNQRYSKRSSRTWKFDNGIILTLVNQISFINSTCQTC